MSRRLSYALLTIGGLCLALGWGLAGRPAPALALLGLTPLGLYLASRKLAHTLNICLLAGALAAAGGLLAGMPFGLALTGWLALLAAWDLDEFSRRLGLASIDEDNPAKRERAHLGRLFSTLGAGVALSLLAINIHVTLPFEASALLAVLAFAGLGWLIQWMRNRQSGI